MQLRLMCSDSCSSEPWMQSTPCLICRSCRFALETAKCRISDGSSSRIRTPWSEASVCLTQSDRSSASTARTWARLPKSSEPKAKLQGVQNSDIRQVSGEDMRSVEGSFVHAPCAGAVDPVEGISSAGRRDAETR